MSELKVAAIIVAAGQGKRMGSFLQKQFLELRGKPVVLYSLLLFQQLSIINEIIMVVPAEKVNCCQKEIVTKYNLTKVIVVAGGKERQDSVWQGLKLVDDAQVVVVHDGARPLLTRQELEDVVKRAGADGGAILAVPVKDTVKVVAVGGVIVETLLRDSLWAAQTPQAFQKDLLVKAYRQAISRGFYGTDDASLVEILGHQVKVVPGSDENIKVTTPADLLLAETILQRREDNAHGNRL